MTIDKKGQVSFGTLPSILLILGVVVVMGVVLSILLTTLRSDSTATGDETRSISNETTTFTLNGNTSIIVGGNIVAGATDDVGVAGSINDATLLITNASDGTLIFGNTSQFGGNYGVTNWTGIDLTHGNLNLTNNSFGVVLNVSYDYDVPVRNAGYNTSSSSLGFYNNLTNQFGLLGTVIGLVLIVTIVIAAFKFRKGGGL